MKLVITPQPIHRNFFIGDAAVTPPRIEVPTLEITDAEAPYWFYAEVDPATAGPMVDIANDNGVWITNFAGEIVGEAADVGKWHYLQVTAKRKAGTTDAIGAQTLRIVSRPVIACVANTTTERFTCAGHGLQAGQAVTFVATSLPAGISAATDFFVISAGLSESEFAVSATRGGSAVNLTTAGTAVKFLPGEVEFGRVEIPAAAASGELVVNPFVFYSKIGSRRLTLPLEVYSSSDADFANTTVIIEAAGSL